LSANPRSARLLAILLGVAVSVSLVLLVFAVAGIDVLELAQRAQLRLAPPRGMRMFRADARLGHRHVPNATVRVRSKEFDVLYSIDAVGARRVPGAPSDRPTAVFLGDSFTFGHGVEDGETYPALVQRHWPEVAVRNRGMNGAGTSHALLLLGQDLRAGGVDVVVYSWLVIHNWRNYLDRGWLEMVARSKQKLPLFDVVDGRPRWVRLADERDGLSREEPGFVEHEWQITLALIEEMARRTWAQGARFVVVVLPVATGVPMQDEARARLLPFLAERGIEAVDLQATLPVTPDDFYPVDGHPKAEWHRRVANAIAAAIDPRAPGPMIAGSAPRAAPR